jgi:hypothetical protein
MSCLDNKNVGPRQTPLWTPEKLDEAGKKAGQAQAWARKARMGALKKDPFEVLAVEEELRVYSIFLALIVAFSYGNSTPTVLNHIGLEGDDILVFFKIPTIVLLISSIVSALVNGVALAPPKRRSSFVWAMKGLMGGPLAVRQLQKLDDLKTFGESESQ